MAACLRESGLPPHTLSRNTWFCLVYCLVRANPLASFNPKRSLVHRRLASAALQALFGYLQSQT